MKRLREQSAPGQGTTPAQGPATTSIQQLRPPIQNGPLAASLRLLSTQGTDPFNVVTSGSNMMPSIRPNMPVPAGSMRPQLSSNQQPAQQPQPQQSLGAVRVSGLSASLLLSLSVCDLMCEIIYL